MTLGKGKGDSLKGDSLTRPYGVFAGKGDSRWERGQPDPSLWGFC
jgi:hypothetical protein